VKNNIYIIKKFINLGEIVRVSGDIIKREGERVSPHSKFYVWEDKLFEPVYYRGKKVVHHILKQENLTNDFNKLMFDYHCDARMERRHNISDTYNKFHKFKKEDISKENIKLINDKFKNDFIYFDYEMIS